MTSHSTTSTMNHHRRVWKTTSRTIAKQLVPTMAAITRAESAAWTATAPIARAMAVQMTRSRTFIPPLPRRPPHRIPRRGRDVRDAVVVVELLTQGVSLGSELVALATSSQASAGPNLDSDEEQERHEHEGGDHRHNDVGRGH
jgi:hypothetical protein